MEYVVIPFSRESSQPRDWTQVSCTAGRSEAHVRCYKWFIYRGGVTPSYISVPYWILYNSKYFFFPLLFCLPRGSIDSLFFYPLWKQAKLWHIGILLLESVSWVIMPIYFTTTLLKCIQSLTYWYRGKGSIYITKCLLSESLQSCREAKVTTLVSWHFLLPQLHSVSAAYGIV